MSSLNTTSADVDAIKNITRTITQVWSYLLICLGIVGHSLNIYVFTRPKFRSNPCVRYFLASSISGLFVTIVTVLLRLLQVVYSIDAFGYSTASCKILTYIAQWAKYLKRLLPKSVSFILILYRTQTSWYIALAGIDRFLSSSRSVAVRKWSNVHTASIITLLATIAVALAYIYIPIQYRLQQARVRCPTKQGDNLLFFGIWNLIIYSLGPPIVMLIFGSLTIRHLKSSVRPIAIHNTGTQNQSAPQGYSQRQKITDRQLIPMMIVQFIYFGVLSSFAAINWIYTSLTSNTVPDALQNAKDDLFSNISGYLGITSACTSFYAFTLSGQLFRRELILLFKRRKRWNREITRNIVPSPQKN